MNQSAALHIAIDAIRHIKRERRQDPDQLSTWDMAIETLQAMQLGLDGESDVEYLEDNNGKVIHWKEEAS
jgi:hypothetical protein